MTPARKNAKRTRTAAGPSASAPIALQLLILEDRPSDAELMLIELRRAGFEPDWKRVDSEKEFLAALDPSLDLILADYHLPQFDGQRALQLLKKSGLDIPFILVSGAVGEETAVEMMKQGAADYVLKDRMARLGQAVVHVLEDKRLQREKARAEQALGESEAKYRALFDTTPEAITLIGLDGRILDFNKATAELAALPREKLLGKHFTKVGVLKPKDIPKYLGVFAQVIGGKEDAFLDIEIKRGKEHRWVEVFLNLLREGGKVSGIQVISRDITARKRAEESLHESEDRFRDLVENVHDLVCTHDLEGRILSANRAASDLTGYTLDELVGRNLRDMLPPENHPLFARYLAEIRKKGAASGLMTVVTKSGEKRIWEYHNTLRSEGVAEPVVRGYARDITEQRRAERALRTSEERYRTLAEAAQDMIILLDQTGKILYTNQFAAKQFGKSPGDLIGRNIGKVFPREIASRQQANVQKVFQSGEALYVEAPVAFPAGVTWLGTWLSPVAGEKGGVSGVLIVSRDITARKRTEAERGVLLEIMEGVAATEGLQDYLALVRQALSKVIFAENLFVVLKNRETGLFEEVFAVDEFDAPMPPSRLEKSITAYVFRTGEPLLLDRARFEELEKRGEVEQVGTAQAAWLGAPLKTPTETIGVMAVQNYRDENCYSERDREFLASVGAQVALALERKRAEESLRESQERLSSLFGTALDAILTVDEEQRIVMFNPAAEKLFGCPAGEALGQSLDLFVPEPAREKHRQLVNEFSLSERTQGSKHTPTSESTCRKTDGTLFPSEISISWYESGGRKFYTAILRDISERRQAETQLRLQGAALESAANAIVITDREGSIQWVNQAWRQLTGYTLEEAIGKNPRILKSGVQDRAFYKNLWDTILAGKVWRSELVNKRKDGSFYTEEETITPLAGADGEITHFIGIKQDISARKQAEERIAASEAELRALFASMTDVVIVYDADGRYVKIAPTNPANLYRPPYEMTGMAVHEILSPEKADFIVAKVREAIAASGTVTCEYSLDFPEGDRWFSASVSPLSENTVVWVAHDITARKQSEAAIQRQLKEIMALHSVAMAGSHAASEDELIELATRIIGAEFYPDHCGVLLVDEAAGTLAPHPSYHGIPPEKRRSHAIGQGITGKVVESGLPLRVSDVRREAQYLEISPGTHSELCVPLKIGGQVIGVINAESAQPGFFSPDDERLLVTIAGQLAAGIERLRAEASERQQRIVAEALRDTAAVLNTTLDLDEIMDRILENVAGVVPFTSGCIFLIEEGIARVVRQRGYQKHGLEDWIAQLRLPIMETPNLRRMVETQQPVLVADTRADPDWVEYPETAWIAAYLAAPVVVKGEVVGMIGLDHEQAGFFGAASIEHLMAFANQAASAIENARLYQEALRAAERRAVLHRSSQEMVRVSRDPEQVYEAARQAASQLMPAEVFTVALLDEERQELDATYLFDNVGRHPPLRIPLGQGFSSQVIISGEAILNNDLQKSPLQAVHFGSEAQVRSVLAVPMRIGGKVIGAISSQSYQPGAFDQEDRLLLEMLAAQTAAAIENARLFSETQHRLREMEALVQVSEATGRTLELDILLENILAAALKAIPAAEKGSISLREDGRLRLHSLVGYADERLRGLFFEPGEGFVSQALREGRAMLVHDASAEKMPRSGSEIEEMLAIQSAVIAPLISKERIIGIISLDNASRKSAFTEADTRLLVTLAAEAAMAIENSRLYIQTQRRAEEFASLYETARDLAGRHDLPSLIQTIVERARLLLHASDGAMYLYDAARQALDSVVVTNPAMPRLNLKLGEGLAGRVVQERQAMIVDDYRAWEGRVARYEGVPISAVVDVPMLHGGELVGVLVVHEMGDTGRRFTEEDARLLSLFAAQAAGAVYNARLLEETRQRLAELEAVNRVSTALRTAGRVEDMLPLMLDETLELVKAEVGAIWLYDAVEGKLQPMVAFGWQTGLPHKKLGPGEGIIGHTFNLNEVYVTPDYHTDPHLFAANKKYIPAGWGGVCVPLRTFNQTLGIFIVSIPSSRQLTSGEIKLLTTVAEISGNAIRRAMLHEQTELQLHRLATLRAIDTAISSLFDLRLTLDILLEHTVAQLKVDAVSVLTFNPNTLMLEFAAGRGFRGQATAQLRLRLGESQAGRAALERRRIFIPQLQEANSVFAQPELLAGEDFAAYCALPLIAKGQVKGVLEVFHRQPLERDADWMNFLETLAGQFALAIENASLFDGLQRSNIALSLAYDATIEGWSKALDLRDEETEGHTQRVTDLTLRLGRALNIGEDEMVHIRRGALLHDIGKMGVPDSILHKPGPLTDDEWALMRKHPVFAFDMLLPIDFLRPALDIPYCHHEKWDGSGYPRSLKGEQIPLAARIFAVVDVWDALSSDRPYRQAWPKEKVINYLEEQSGAHFDPRVVEAFLKLIEGNEVAGIMKSVE